MASTPFPKSPLPTKRKVPSPLSKGKWSNKIALFLAVLATASTALLWQHMTVSQSGDSSQFAQLQQSIAELQATAEQNQRHLEAELNNSQKNIDRLLNDRNTTSQQAIFEASYLIRLAHLHLSLGNDLQTSLKLLHMALERLSPFHSSQATELKKALTHDISLLKSVSVVDTSDIWMQINTLSEKIATLPIRPEAPKQTQVMPAQNTHDKTTPKDAFWDKVKRSLSSLKSLIVIHHFDKPVTPLLSPEQLLYLRENIQLKLAQAQWAALYQKEALYKQSLSIAAEWMNTYDQNQKANVAIIQKLKQLAMINIEPAHPNQLKSMTLLHKTATPATQNKTQAKAPTSTQKVNP